MSGGYFNYQDGMLKDEMFGYVPKGKRPPDTFEDKEMSELINDVFDVIHAFDWYKSADTCEESYLQAKNEFKKKWLIADRKDRVKRIVDEALEDTRNDLYKTFMIELGDDSVENH